LNSIFDILEFSRIREELAECATSPLGSDLARSIKPIPDRIDLQESLSQTTELKTLLERDQALPIDGIIDIRPALKKAAIENSVLREDELCQICQTLSVVRRLAAYFGPKRENVPVLAKITGRLKPLPEIEEAIRQAIDVKTYKVKDNASPQLSRIRKQIFVSQERARRIIDSLLKTYGARGILQENVVSVRDGRLVLIVKDEFKRKVPGLVHGQSSSGVSLFIEPIEVLEANNDIRELYLEEQREIERILARLSAVVREALADIEENTFVLSQIDLVYAKARLSQRLNAHPPELIDETKIALFGARHPLLYFRIGEKNVVPLDVQIGESFLSIVISGPNAGGKTVALKTVGLLTMMANSGLHIPALPHSQIGDIRHVFAIIGDQQSIENDLSTFSSHLTNINHILSRADDHSLVLIDEIGAGTDPEEGAALAIAVLKHLLTKKSLSIVTTHQSALKAFAYQAEGVENGSMEFDVKTLQPTYLFRLGIPGSSYAFEIAKRLGLPAEVTDEARNLVGEQKSSLEGLILQLEEKIQRHNDLLRQANIRESEFRGLSKLYNEKTDALNKNEKQLKKQAILEAEEILARANATVENAVREIRESMAKPETIKQAKETIEKEKSTIEKMKRSLAETAPAFHANGSERPTLGDTVLWERYGSTGVVVSEEDKKGRVYVQSEGIKVRAPLEELKKIKAKKSASASSLNIRMAPREHYNWEIDLRGLRAEEAIEKVDEFLDQAVLAGFSEVRVIHGKGTGRLKTSINDFLKKNDRVLQTRLGNWNEGDWGVTVVELRKD
jgi:DNA mismatch repair protein MutS2